jgi:Skp family chaperone for outer membrane proteins
MSTKRAVLAILFLGLLMTALPGKPARAAEAKFPVFATLDVEKAFNGYDKKTQLDAKLQADKAQADEKLRLRSDNAFLTADEFTQLADLAAKPTKTDDDKTKIAALTKTANDRQAEYTGLQQKKDATDAEKARLQELQSMGEKAKAAFDAEQTSLYQKLQKQQVDLSKQIMQDVEVAATNVAKAKGITMVFNKSFGEPGFIIYSGMDITDEVLAKLNKAK